MTKATKTDMNIDRKENLGTKGGGLATWNVRGLFEEGALKQINNECKKYNFDVIALQETKLHGRETIELDNYILFKSGGKNRMFGTGFLVSKKFVGATIC